MGTLTVEKSATAVDIAFNEGKMLVFLEDGRELSVPLEWFPKLRNVKTARLKKWRFIGNGEGIHWEELDEDILVENLLK